MYAVSEQYRFQPGANLFNLNSASFCHLDDVNNLTSFSSPYVNFMAANEHVGCLGDSVHSTKQVIIWGSFSVNSPANGKPSQEGEFSLAQWNMDGTLSSPSATSRVPPKVILLCESAVGLDSPLEVESRPKLSKVGIHRRRASVNSIMGSPIPEEAKNSINDSNIANMNQQFLNRAEEVVCESFELGMSFTESENQLCQLIERILRNN